MSLSVVDRNGMLTDELRELLARRLSYALSRFESRIRRKTVVFDDANGPRGGVDKQCRVTVKLDRTGDVVIREQDADISKCITRAAERIGRAVARAIERAQHTYRKKPLNAGPM
ncbi:MAG: HPF/RaiA family ribosome-associated protein [Pirellulales bacterium]|nr:HPF/RaiA family ribosome-associated protein [Pirellulales bacterium]